MLPMRKRLLSKWLQLVCLLAVLLLGAYFRFSGINWDENFHLHPDERFLTMIETSIATEDSVRDYFDTENSSLNPHNVRDGNGNQSFPFFVYGTLPIFLVRFIGEALNQTGYSQIHIVGRYLSGLFDLGTVILIFLIAKKMFKSGWVGVISAAFYAFAALPIQISHFFIVDNFTTFFSTAAIYLAARVYRHVSEADCQSASTENGQHYLLGNWSGFQYYLFFALALAMAAASKLNAIVVAFLLPLSLLIALPKKEITFQSKYLHLLIRNLILAGIFSIIFFRLFQPYAFAGPSFFNFRINPEWLNDLSELQALSSGLSNYPPSLQWTRRSVIFPIKNMIFWGMGIAFGIISIASLVIMAIDFFRGKKGAYILVLFWNIAYIFWQALRWNPTMRYFLLVYPTMALSAGWFLIYGLDNVWRVEIKSTVWKFSKLFLTTIIILVSLGWGFAFTNIYDQPMTRIAASDWIYRNVEGPINLIFKDENNQFTQPLPFRKTFTLDPTEQLEIDFSTSGAFSADELAIEYVLTESEQHAQYAKITLEQIGSTVPMLETNTIIPAASGTDQRGVEWAIPLPNVMHFNQDASYRLTIDTSPAGVSIRLMGSLLLGNNQNQARISQSVFTFSQGIEANGEYQANFTPLETGMVTGVRLFKARSALTDGSHVPVAISITDQTNGELIAEGDAEISRNLAADSRGESVQIDFDQPVMLTSEKTYTLGILNKDPQETLFITGSFTAKETDWDDALPLFMYGLNPFDLFSGIYQSDLNFQMYWDDNPDKLSRFVSILDQADYIIMSSNRQWGSVTQAEEKYPLSTHLYEGLIACGSQDVQSCYINAEPSGQVGALGFRLVQTFHAQPEIFGIRFNSQNAEEAFTVYDHPKVFVFQKSEAFTFDSMLTYLDQVDLDQVLNLPPQEIEKRPGKLELPQQQWAAQKNAGTWSEIFDAGAIQNSSPIISILVWYFFIAIIGWTMVPFTRVIFYGLRYKGWGLSRLLGLIVLSYIVWLGGSLGISVTRGFILLAFLALAGINAVFFIRNRHALFADFRANIHSILTIELIFISFFLIFLLIRMGNPDLWHPYKGGEKPMDFAYFNALIKSVHFPPYDPWYAGGTINYYYWGFVLAAVPTKLLGILPSIAYNLFLPTFFAMTAIGAYTIGINFLNPTSKKKELIGGLIAAVFVLFIGNLGTVKMIFQGFIRLGEAYLPFSPDGFLGNLRVFFTGILEYFKLGRFNYYPGDWYWIPSRAIPGEPITEFPFFTFLYGDPHAHLFAYPITLLSFGWALSTIINKWKFKNSFALWINLLTGALIVGALRPTNTWDLPVFLVISIFSMIYASLKYGGSTHACLPALTDKGRNILTSICYALIFIIFSFVLFSPFAKWYGQAYTSFAIWEGDKTPLWAYLSHWGIFLFIICSWLIKEVIQWMKSTPISKVKDWLKNRGLIIFSVVLIAGFWVYLLFNGIFVLFIIIPITLVAFLLSLRKGITDAERVVLLMVSLGVGLTLLVELIVLSGDIGRMNTVFKFYLQAWTCLALAASYALYSMLPIVKSEKTNNWGMAWRTLLILLLLSGILYPIFASVDKMTDRISQGIPLSLDGMDYMQYSQYPENNVMMDLSQDHRLIRWMQDNIEGTPRIIEANVPEYRWGSRISIYTGLPGVVGWNWHQRQQRAINPSDWVFKRVEDVQTFYSTLDFEVVKRLVNQYEIDYVVIGQLERSVYSQDGISKFTQTPGDFFEIIYDEGETLLLKVNRYDD
jgi:YYY domain-containing protein